MNDTPKKRSKAARDQDRRTINLFERHEVRHWMNRFRISHAELVEAVRKAGNRVEDVANYLGASTPKPIETDPPPSEVLGPGDVDSVPTDQIQPPQEGQE